MVNIYHYKERNPEDTIEIITNFFKLKKIEIKLISKSKTEINTFSCRYALYYKNTEILAANGKGITEQLSQASCYGELYERFCFYMYVIPKNPYSYNQICQEQIYNNQKKITIDELLTDEHTFKLLQQIIPDMNEQYLEEYLSIKFNNNLKGNIFYDLNNMSNISYKNMHLLQMITATNGVAAGNTLEEALVQGSSELYEREALTLFYENSIQQFFEINQQNLNFEFQKIINKLKEKNIETYIYDLSYNLNIPVLMVLVFHKKTKTFYYNFGSHPIFNIALERCFTELYQNMPIFDSIAQDIVFYRENSLKYNILYSATITAKHHYGLINELLIFNSIQKNNYNEAIFLDDQNKYTNKQLLDYINILNYKNNTIFQWTNLSLDPNIFTIYIIEKKFTQITFLHQMIDIQKFKKKDQIILFELFKRLSKDYNKLITNNISINENYLKYYINNFLNLIQQLNFDTNEQKVKVFFSYFNTNYYESSKFVPKDPISPLPYYMLLDIFFSEILEKYEIKEKQLYNIYQLIESYYKQKYTKEQIQKILKWLHYDKDIELNFKLEDMTPTWYINKIFIESLYTYYHSQEYYDFLNIFGVNNK